MTVIIEKNKTYIELFLNNKTNIPIICNINQRLMNNLNVKNKCLSVERLDINTVGIPLINIKDPNKYILSICRKNVNNEYVGYAERRFPISKYYNYNEFLFMFNTLLHELIQYAYDNKNTVAYDIFANIPLNQEFRKPTLILDSDNHFYFTIPLFGNDNDFFFNDFKIGFNHDLKLLLSSFIFDYHEKGLLASDDLNIPFFNFSRRECYYTIELNKYYDLPLNITELPILNGLEYDFIVKIKQDASSLNFFGIERLILTSNNKLKNSIVIQQSDQLYNVVIPYDQEILVDYNVSNEAATRALDDTVIYIPKIRRYINFLSDTIDRVDINIYYKLFNDDEIYNFELHPRGLIQIKLLIE